MIIGSAKIILPLENSDRLTRNKFNKIADRGLIFMIKFLVSDRAIFPCLRDGGRIERTLMVSGIDQTWMPMYSVPCDL